MKKPIQMFALKDNLSSHYTVFVSASLINLCFTLSVTAQFMGYWCTDDNCCYYGICHTSKKWHHILKIKAIM